MQSTLMMVIGVGTVNIEGINSKDIVKLLTCWKICVFLSKLSISLCV